MPYRKTYRRRPRKYVRKTTYRRKYASTLDNKVNRFIQHENSIITCTSAVQYFNYSFQLLNTPQYNAFQSLYDQGKLEKVQIKVRPLNSVALATATGVEPVWSVIDYDGAYPTSDNQYNCYQTLVKTPHNRVHTRTFKPKCLIPMGSGSQMVINSPWMDTTGGANEEHYGLALRIPPDADETVQFEVTIKYWLAYRNVR